VSVCVCVEFLSKILRLIAAWGKGFVPMSQTQTDSCQDEGDGRGGVGEGSGRPNGRQPETQPVLRIRDVYPGSRTDHDFYPARIQDLGSRIPDPKPGRKERGKKNLLPTVYTFLLKLTPPPFTETLLNFC